MTHIIWDIYACFASAICWALCPLNRELYLLRSFDLGKSPLDLVQVLSTLNTWPTRPLPKSRETLATSSPTSRLMFDGSSNNHFCTDCHCHTSSVYFPYSALRGHNCVSSEMAPQSTPPFSICNSTFISMDDVTARPSQRGAVWQPHTALSLHVIPMIKQAKTLRFPGISIYDIPNVAPSVWWTTWVIIK